MKTSKVYQVKVFKQTGDLWKYRFAVGNSKHVSKVSIALTNSVYKVHERKHYNLSCWE